MNKAFGFIVKVAGVALIVVAMRWLLTAKGSQLPRIRDSTRVYEIKWQWRAVGFAGGTFLLALAIESFIHLPPEVGWFSLLFMSALAFVGLWMATGVVTTDRSGIKKRVFWRTRSLRWEEVTEVRVHNKQGGAVELRAGSRKLIIDYVRFVAVRDLLKQIEEHTQLQPIND